MRRLVAFLVLLGLGGQAQAVGLLIPKEKTVPPLAMLNHQVNITIDEQVAVTKVEQIFRNHTDRQLEATYVFPVPKGATVTKFSMWVNGKEVPGEMIEAKKAKKIYLDIVQKTLDPGLLEYMDHNLLKLSVFPILPHADQKISFSYTSIVPKDHDLINYTYPLKTDGKAIQTLEKFSIKVTLKSQHPLQNIYSPSHAITVTRPNEKQALVLFEKDEGKLDRDFQLYYTAGSKDVGVTALTHRPSASDKGYFMLLISPRSELSKEQQVPRDIVFVLDTSGSMRGKRMEQAKNALNYCLTNLNKQDRFAIVQFATGVNKYTEKWLDADLDNIIPAKKWVSNLEATGGTAINDALSTALAMREKDSSRTFTIVFFTDGRPTIGETDSSKILKNVLAKNTTNTRIFTFGVGDDVNASMLDQLAEESKAVSSYVRENEDIEAHVSSLYNKISHPVLTNLKMTVSDTIKLAEIYPPQLPDLFHGSQLVVLGRYEGKGHAAITLSGSVGKESKQYVYEVSFPEKSTEEKPFVEDLWARRKVGYLLDQIRLNGENKELIDEVVTLSKRYGITTPYTSYLIVPDAPLPIAAGGGPAFRKDMPNVGFDLPKQSAGKPLPVGDFAKAIQGEGGFKENRGKFEGAKLDSEIKSIPKGADPKDAKKADESVKLLQSAQTKQKAYEQAHGYFINKQLAEVQGGKLGVNLSVWSNELRNQTQVAKSAVKRVQNRNCIEVGGVWIDENFTPKMQTLTVKAMSKAYFRILEMHPEVKDVYQMGNYLVWVTPSNQALVVDTAEGREDMTDAEITALFAVPKKK